MVAKRKTTPKEAALAIDKPVREWTAQRALHSIGLTTLVKQKQTALSERNVAAIYNFARTIEIGALKTGRELYGQTRPN